MNLQKLMQEAQKMQSKMQEAQKELENLVVEGQAGAGMVKITMTGKYQAKKAFISKDVFDEMDQEMLQDLFVAAVNDAVRKIENETKGKIQNLTKGIDLPPDIAGMAGES